MSAGSAYEITHASSKDVISTAQKHDLNLNKREDFEFLQKLQNNEIQQEQIKQELEILTTEHDTVSRQINAEQYSQASAKTNTEKLEPELTERRLALVFGNSEYITGTSLKNPVNDANLMEGTLKELNFEVIKKLNANKEEMMEAVREFTEKLPDYDVALFYYAGHGNQVDGKNYLIPTDAHLEKPTDCRFEAIEVEFIVEEFEKYQDNTNIVILDACRNNPYTAWARGGEAGFRAMNFSSGTIIAYATSEGATAADGKGANGLYTEELVKQMAVPQSILSVFMNTRAQVRKMSNGAQIPTEWNKLNGDFFFRK